MNIALNSTHRAADSAHRAVDHLAGSAHQAVDRLRDGMDDARGRVDDFGHRLVQRGDAWMGEARGSVRDHPLLAVGCAIGLIWLIASWMRR